MEKSDKRSLKRHKNKGQRIYNSGIQQVTKNDHKKHEKGTKKKIKQEKKTVEKRSSKRTKVSEKTQ